MPTLKQIFSDDDFYRMTDDDKLAAIGRFAPEFNDLADEDKVQAYERFAAGYGGRKETIKIGTAKPAAQEPVEPAGEEPGLLERAGNYIKENLPTKETLSSIYHPVLAGGGAMVGGIVGAGGGLPTGPGAIGTAALGAGLLGAAGEKTADAIDNFIGVEGAQQGTLGDELIDTGKEVAVNALSAGAPMAAAAAPLKSGILNAIKGATAGGMGYAAGQEVEKLDQMRQGEYQPESVGGEITNAAKNIGVGAVLDAAGNVVSAVPGAIKSALNGPSASVKAAKPGLQEAEDLGIDVMTSDAYKPKTFIGRSAQAVGERIPLAGTGGKRLKQQEQRVQAVKNVLGEYGIEDNSPHFTDEVMNGLSQKREADLVKYTKWKGGIITRLDQVGPVPVDKAVAKIDEEVARLKEISPDGYNQAIYFFEGFKKDIQGKNLTNIEENRKRLGDAFKSPDLATIRTAAEKSVGKIYGALREDIGGFVKANGGPDDFKQWDFANKKLKGMSQELNIGVVRRTLKNGEETPEAIRSMLFSKKPSDVRRLYRDLNKEGRANARVAILQEAAINAGGVESVSPDRFVQQVKRMGDQFGVFFHGNDLKKINGLSRALELTRRGGDAALHPPTGVQNAPFIGGVVLTDLFGSGGAALASAGGIGGLARVIESRRVRNLLMTIPNIKRGSAEETLAVKRALIAMQEEYDRQQTERKKKGK